MCLNNLRPSSTCLRLHGSGYPHALPRVTLPSSFPLLTLVPIFPRLASPEIDILSHASGPWVAKFDLNRSPADVQVNLSSRGRSRRRWGGIALAFHVALILPVCLDSAVQTSLPSSSTPSHCYCWPPPPYPTTWNLKYCFPRYTIGRTLNDILAFGTLSFAAECPSDHPFRSKPASPPSSIAGPKFGMELTQSYDGWPTMVCAQARTSAGRGL